jgi:predicted MFS family arabinose efflux permease
VNVPIVLIIIVLGFRLLPVGGGQVGAPFDWAGSVLLSAMLIAVAYGLQGLGAVMQGATPEQLFAFALAVALVPLFVWVERRASDPVVQLALFGRVQILIILSLAFAAGVAEAVTLYVPSLLVSAHGMSESVASFQLIPMVMAMAVASPISGRLLDRHGAKPVVLSGVMLMVLGLVIIGAWPTSMTGYYLFSVLFGLGIAVLLGAALRYMMLGEAEARERGAAQALLTITISIGQMIGAALMGSVAASQADRTHGYALALLVTAALLTVVLLTGSQLRLRPATTESAQA